MSLRKTSVEISEELPATARHVHSTSPLEKQINVTILEDLGFTARREEVKSLSTMQGLDLMAPEVMSGAWRS